jgi:hypothetical protein
MFVSEDFRHESIEFWNRVQNDHVHQEHLFLVANLHESYFLALELHERWSPLTVYPNDVHLEQRFCLWQILS